MLEQPRLSKMRWFPFWRALLQLPGVEESWLATCAYGRFEEGCIRKEFVFLGAWCRPRTFAAAALVATRISALRAP